MRMDERNAPASTNVLIAAPARPLLSPVATAALASAVAATPGILEAHMPLVVASGVSEASTPALVLILAPSATPHSVLESLGPKLGSIIPQDVSLNIWPLAPEDPLVPAVRNADCRIFADPTVRAPWWKFWG